MEGPAQAPSIGRIVWVGVDGSTYPAIVTAVLEDDRIAAVVFGSSPEAARQFYGLPYSDEPKPGTWRWPEIVR